MERRLADAIIAAHHRFWKVRRHAYRTGDSTILQEVLAPPALGDEEQQLRRLRDTGQRAVLDVRHDLHVALLSPERAVVYDEYRNCSVLVEATTGYPVSERSESVEHISFEMVRMGGIWKVITIWRTK